MLQTAEVSYKAGWFEEKDRKSYRQGIPGARQEQPSDIQLLGLTHCHTNCVLVNGTGNFCPIQEAGVPLWSD